MNYEIFDEKYLIICDKKFKYLDTIRPIEINLTIPKDKIDNFIKRKKYSEIDLVKSLKNEFSLDDAYKITFCKFKLSDDIKNISGVYIWVLDNEIIYIGETKKLKNRFNSGYGNISPRNIFSGGQSTNCKMNRLVLKCANENKCIKLYFYETDNYKELERELIEKFFPIYNSRL